MWAEWPGFLQAEWPGFLYLLVLHKSPRILSKTENTQILRSSASPVIIQGTILQSTSGEFFNNQLVYLSIQNSEKHLF